MVIGRGILNTASWWRVVSLTVIFLLGWSAIDQFQARPALRGMIVFLILLAAAVVAALGWLLCDQRTRAEKQAVEMISRVDRRHGLSVVDK